MWSVIRTMWRVFLHTFRRRVTIQYPEERQPLPEATRQFPFLVFDGDDWHKGMR